MNVIGFNPNTIIIDPRTGQLSGEGVRLMQGLVQVANGEVPIKLPSYTVATVPSATSNLASLIYVSNEAGGAVPAFSDGTNWRRVTDRAIIS